jgi:transposase InsO family protein
VLRLLRGEDLETVSRSLGVTAATLSGWRDAFLAAGEAILTTKPATGEELESERLKAKLGAAWRPIALWPDGGAGHEPGHIAGDWQILRARHGLPRLAVRTFWRLPQPCSRANRAASAARTKRRDDRCCADGGDPRHTRRQPFSWRRPSQGLGTTASRRNSHVITARARLMRENDLLAPTRVGSAHGPRAHDGTIIPATVDTMWGTDLTATFTGEDQAAVFIAVDHCSAECVGIHPSSGIPTDRSRSVGTFASFAHARANRFEALEPIRQGVRRHFGGFAAAVARGLKLRHDHGSQYMSDHFQKEIAFLGIESSPAFVRAPEGNGCAERFIRIGSGFGQRFQPANDPIPQLAVAA